MHKWGGDQDSLVDREAFRVGVQMMKNAGELFVEGNSAAEVMNTIDAFFDELVEALGAAGESDANLAKLSKQATQQPATAPAPAPAPAAAPASEDAPQDKVLKEGPEDAAVDGAAEQVPVHVPVQAVETEVKIDLKAVLEAMLSLRVAHKEREAKIGGAMNKASDKARASQLLYIERAARKAKEAELADRLAAERQRAVEASAALGPPSRIDSHSTMFESQNRLTA